MLVVFVDECLGLHRREAYACDRLVVEDFLDERVSFIRFDLAGAEDVGDCLQLVGTGRTVGWGLGGLLRLALTDLRSVLPWLLTWLLVNHFGFDHFLFGLVVGLLHLVGRVQAAQILRERLA